MQAINKLRKSSSTKILHIVVFLTSLVFLAENLSAQTDPYTSSLTPGSPSGSYSLGGFDNVNLFTGNLNTSMPLITIGGRGKAAFPIMGNFDTLWHINVYQSPPGNYYYEPVITGPSAFLGLQNNIAGGIVKNLSYEPYSTQDLDCANELRESATITTLSFIAPDGTSHNLVDTATHGRYLLHDICTMYTSNTANRGREFVSTDGEGITFVADSDLYDNLPLEGPPPDTPYYSWGVGYDDVPGYLYFPDGTTYRYQSGVLQWIKDKDGNQTSFTYASGRVSSIKDSIGREVDFDYGITESSPYGLCDRITFKGTGGATRYIRLSYKSLSNDLRTTQTGDSSTVKTYPQLFAVSTTTGTFDPIVVSDIWLPNGQSYKLKYNEYRQLARIELPTGGAYEYDYFATQGGDLVRVNKKRVYDENNTLVSVTEFGTPQYDYSMTPQGIHLDVSQKDASNQLLSKSTHYFYGLPNDDYAASVWSRAFTPWTSSKEYKTEMWNAAGTSVLQRVEKTWVQPSTVSWWLSSWGPSTASPSNNPRISEEKTTLVDVNLVSKRTFTYDDTQPFNNINEVAEYDWGSGTAGSFLRKTHTDYITTSGYIGYSGAHLRRLPSVIWVSSDSSGTNKTSYTQYEYDSYSGTNHAALTSRSSVYGFDSTNYGTGNTTRGNVTAVTSYATASNQTGGVTSYMQYDILGNVVKTIDANGNATTISYSDNFGSADSDATTNSTPSQISGYNTFGFSTSTTNPMSWTSYVQYDYFTGKPVNTQDINGVVSKMVYNDSLDRPTQGVSAVGTSLEAQTTIAYDDTNRVIQKTSDLVTENDNLLKSKVLYDGLGRVVENRSYEPDGNYRVVQMQYDSLGRPYKKSNLFRPGDTAYWTTSAFDSLGRVTSVTYPDSAVISTAYDGNRTLVTDQAGKQRISKINALGQLVNMWEIVSASDGSTSSVAFPNTSIAYGYQTNYSYNTLGNLTTVVQGSQQRDFTYDSLSRLLTAQNPESSTISYTYDSTGNLKTKRDARNIKTVYDYDALNRVTKRCYRSIGTGSLGMTTCVSNNETAEPNTPDVTYTYDDTNITNSKGHLTKVDSSVSTTEFIGFDILGHVTSHKQTTNSTAYTTGYTYNLAGALLEETYPSGRKVKNTYASNGDLSQLETQPYGGSYATRASNFTHTAAGAVSSMQLGNGRWESTQFNTRLQTTQTALGTTQNATDLLKLEYSYGTTDNNGNVVSQTITVPGMTYPLIQTYMYDNLNRLKSAEEKSNGTTTWKQTFLFDRYGNRNFDSANTTMLGSCSASVCNPTVSSSNNHFSSGQGWSYDSAGNTTVDAEGKQFTYDAENKQTLVKDASNVTIGTYYYDGAGKRVKKTTATENIVFVYDASSQLIEEYSGSTLQTAYVYAASRLLTTETATGTNYVTSDYLGSPRINTDGSGSATTRHDYMPFGEEIFSYGGRTTGLGYTTDSLRKQFTDYERDRETDLDFAQARYFNNEVGRYTTPDGIGNDNWTVAPQSWNLYAYVRNNPLAYVDAGGKELEIIVNGNTYKVVGDRSNGFTIVGDDGSNKLVRAAANYLEGIRQNRLGGQVQNLITAEGTSTITLGSDGGDVSGGTSIYQSSTGLAAQINVNVSPDPTLASEVQLATEVVVANDLLNKDDPLYFQQNQSSPTAPCAGCPVPNVMDVNPNSFVTNRDQLNVVRYQAEERVRNIYGLPTRGFIMRWKPGGLNLPLIPDYDDNDDDRFQRLFPTLKIDLSNTSSGSSSEPDDEPPPPLPKRKKP